uniref:DUF148 domain-containing protein n=1 Tax=Panagrellus redivivus TaxID=6233 RepID=A0A7E4VHX7_PANRE
MFFTIFAALMAPILAQQWSNTFPIYGRGFAGPTPTMGYHGGEAAIQPQMYGPRGMVMPMQGGQAPQGMSFSPMHQQQQFNMYNRQPQYQGFQPQQQFNPNGPEFPARVVQLPAHARQLSAPTMSRNSPISMPQQNSPIQQEGSVNVESKVSSLPEFLNNADEKIVTEFKTILRTKNMTYDAKIKQIEAEIVPQLDDNHQLQYQKFMKQGDETQQMKRDAIHSKVAQMTGDAQTKFATIAAILKDPSLLEHQRWDKIVEIYNGLEPGLRDEFEAKFADMV